MKKIILFLFLTVFAAACFAEAPKKLTVVLDWFPNPDHAPLIIAEQQGFFKEEGLEVELIGPADPTDPPKWVAAKKADIGITYQPEFMEQVDQGLPLVRIGTLIDKPLNCLVVLDESGIKTLADLKGKLIGSSNSGLSGIMLKVMLAKQGLTEKDIELVNVRYNLTQALLSRKVDAVTGMMRNFEVPQLELNGHKVSAFFPEENGIPNYSELIFIANTNRMYDKRFPRFLAAIKKAVAYLDAHPREAWEQFIQKYPEANNKVNREAWFATIPYFAEDPAEFDRDEWRRFAKFMQENQLIKKSRPVSRYAVMV
ncbi:ABC transporter substrate-binding protein [Aquicella lusitana]|jgi:ABC-type nitrate/sulfonate/bicarbonate transport systems, periplasmic components|uniref:Putative hydroxymethylpyrimidine transport system substrate-binding protein n=1 Tax=Aquicella lusitana TaxID=254246 RepID=A0A370GGQ2_9COXI|nr:ABC transporter substrate-binding protein [Aquicella lusitana]RDI42841.1 putative hydroxymethylpyrimidine transport system substrate-binding protein [Aquicella lusitana]VVC73084.1 Putative thiamine biosynthesis protein [Aquicella lusitana]